MHQDGWYQISFRVPNQMLDLIVADLYAEGCLGLDIRDASHLAPPENLRPGWVEVYSSWRVDAESSAQDRQTMIHNRLGSISTQLGMASAKQQPVQVDKHNILINTLAPQDWANNWKSHFSPIQAGRFYVHPSWHKPDPQCLSIVIDPGMAFGTGLHPTTYLCLEGIDRLVLQRHIDSVLDVGCGTGILAIAAALARVDRVVAMDCDELAVRITQANINLNGLGQRIEIGPSALAKGAGTFDLIVANILSGVLRELRIDLSSRLKSRGTLLLSGLLWSERETVTKDFEKCGLVLEQTHRKQEWALLQLRVPA